MDLNGQEKVEEMVRRREEGKRQVNCVADTMLRNISSTLHFTAEATETLKNIFAQLIYGADTRLGREIELAASLRGVGWESPQGCALLGPGTPGQAACVTFRSYFGC